MRFTVPKADTVKYMLGVECLPAGVIAWHRSEAACQIWDQLAADFNFVDELWNIADVSQEFEIPGASRVFHP